MQVISGLIGRKKLHLEAPTADRLELEIKTFIEWFNAASTTDPVLKAAIAHFWFVTIHPLKMATVESPARLAICRLRAPMKRKIVFTECPRKLKRNEKSTTTHLRELSGAT